MLTNWEVRNKTPQKGIVVDAVVGMTIAQLPNGRVGTALKPIINELVYALKNNARRVVFSNRFTRQGVTLVELIRREILGMGVHRDRIVIPSPCRNVGIKNTFEEALFAIQMCKKNKWQTLLVVGNHLHMRRVLAAFEVVMTQEDYHVTLYNKSVGKHDNSYGPNGAVQWRFRYASWFFLYEILLALPASIAFGWWKVF